MTGFRSCAQPSLLGACASGRRDAAVPDPTGRLPEESLSAEALRLSFAAKGMSAEELVALSGAHTVRANIMQSWMRNAS